MVALAGEAHVHRQVAIAEEQQVEALDTPDFFQVSKAGHLLDEGDHQRLRIGRGEIVGCRLGQPVVGRTRGAGGAAIAARSVLHRAHCPFGVFGARDVGDDHAQRASLEIGQDRRRLIPRHPHQWNDAGALGGADEVLARLGADQVVLGVDQHEVEPGMPEELHQFGRVEAQQRADDRLSRGQPVLQRIVQPHHREAIGLHA